MKRIGSHSLITIFFCFMSLQTLAQDAPSAAPVDQNGKVTGRLIDAQKKPVSYATITLLRTDSTVVTGNLSNDNGSFSISPTGFGNFILRINAIGVQTQYVKDVSVSAAAPEKNVGDIKLSGGENTLKTVEVVGEKPLIQMNVDKKVFNVEKNITSSGGSAADVLQNVPSVSVASDGTVSLRGKTDVTILIDGKPATMFGGDIQSALQSLPASSIENIEVITNPSAKYDAQGLTGIINIITKKDSRLGVNGSVTSGIGSNKKYNENFGINMRKGKWNVFLNSSFRYNYNYNKTITDWVNANNSYTHNFEEDPRTFKGFFNTAGVTYDWNPSNSITYTQNVNIMDHSYTDFSTYSPYDSVGKSLGLTSRLSAAGGGPHSYSSALDYKHKFNKKDEDLNIDATYSMANYSRTQEYNTTIYSPTTSGSLGPIVETAPTTGSNGSFNVWADYNDPVFTKNGKLGLGFKSQFLWYQSENTPVVDTPGHLKAVDYSLLNNFKYTQQIHAVYINWNDQIDKFTYQAGLRAEDAIYNGVDYIPDTLNFSNNFLSLFPSAFVSYQLPKQQSIYLNYSRRTNRPSYWNMLPFKDVSNPGIVQGGNPNLEPEFINNIEFSYSKQTTRGDNIIISTYFQYTQNLIERISYLISKTNSDTTLRAFVGKQYIHPVNLASGTTYGIDATAHVQIIPIWDATLSVNAFQSHIMVGNIDQNANDFINDRSGISSIAKLNTSIKTPGNFTLQLNFQYESPKVIAQGEMVKTYWMDMAIRKTLWNNKVAVVFNVSDVFNTRKYTSIYDVPNVYHETYLRDRETQVANFSVTYRFGKSPLDKLTDVPSGGRRKGKTNAPGNQPSDKDRENNLKESDENTDQGGQNNNTTPTPTPPPSGGNKEPVKHN